MHEKWYNKIMPDKRFKIFVYLIQNKNKVHIIRFLTTKCIFVLPIYAVTRFKVKEWQTENLLLVISVYWITTIVTCNNDNCYSPNNTLKNHESLGINETNCVSMYFLQFESIEAMRNNITGRLSINANWHNSREHGIIYLLYGLYYDYSIAKSIGPDRTYRYISYDINLENRLTIKRKPIF